MAIGNCGIIGIGLMGGSLGLALRCRGVRVVAVDESEAALGRALEKGAADEGSPDPTILSNADLVVICTPPRAILPAAAKALPHLTPGSLVADFASVKGPLVYQLEELLQPKLRFIGLHPMCGSAGQGVEAAQAALFTGAVLVMTPTTATVRSALEEAGELARLLQMRVISLTPEEHDRQVAWVSHLPYLLAAALARVAPGLDCAGPSFRDATRVAMSPPVLWEEILSLNRSHLAAAVDQLCAELSRLGGLEGERLKAALEEARSRRGGWDALRKGNG